MPRVAAKTNRASQKDRLDRCIDALLQNPDAACVGGSELCCGGCGSGGELVEGLAAFVSHSSAAKRAFISKGGIEAIYVLISKAVPVDDNEAGPGPGSRTQEADEFGYKADASAGDEVRALGALVLLQCLTDSPEGQSLTLQGRAELLHAVLKMSCSQDMEAEGLKHAALKVLGGWHEEVETRGDIIAKWLQQCAVERTLTPSHPSNSRNQQQNVGQNWNVLLIALQASNHPMLSVRRAAAHLFTAAMKCYRNVQEASEHTRSFSVAEEDAISLMNSICCSAADTIAESTAMSSGNVPPRFAQLARTILSPQGGRGDSSYLMMRHQEDARVQRQQVMGLLDLACALLEELEPATTTRDHPKALSTPKATSSALSVGAEASCPTDTHENRSLESVPSNCVEAALPTASPWWLHHTSMINLVLRAFCCAWGLPPPPLSPLPHSSPTSSYDNPEVSQQQGKPSALLPFTFSSDPAKADLDRMQQKLAMMLLTGGNKCVDISVAASTGMVVLQDHQVKELALDTLILMLRNQYGLSAIAHCCASWEDAAHDMGTGKATSREENSVPEVLALRILHRLILEVLMKETPAHIRAALSLLGALRVNAFSDAWVMQHEKDGVTLETQPGAQSAERVSKAMAAMVELLGVTCDVFDRAWEAEGLSLDGLMNSNHACAVTTACRQGHHHDMDPSSCLKGHQGGTSLFHNSLGKETGTVKGDTAEFPSMTLHPSTAPKPAGPVFGFPQVTLISPQPHQATSQVPQSVMALSAESAGYKPVERLLKVEMGLGHRVLIQVLQAWKRLSEEGGTGVAAALECLPWWPRVMLASLHDRRLVSAAAAQIKAPTPQRGVPSAGIRCGFAASDHNNNIDLDSLTGGFEELSLAWASEDTKVQDSSSSCRVLWSNGVRPYPSHVTPQQLQQQKAGGLLDVALGIVGEDEEKRTDVINTSSAPRRDDGGMSCTDTAWRDDGGMSCTDTAWRDGGGMSCTDTATVLPHDQAFLLPDGLVEDPLLKGGVDAEFAEYLKEVFADCMDMDEEHSCTVPETDQSCTKADVKSSLSISPPLEMDPGTLSILSGNRGRAGCNDEGEGALFEPWSGLLPTSVPPISAVALKEQVVPRSETKDLAKKPLVDLDQPNDGSLGKQSLTTNEALTKVLKSDAELLQEAMEFLPDLDAVADQLCMKYDYFG